MFSIFFPLALLIIFTQLIQFSCSGTKKGLQMEKERNNMSYKVATKEANVTITIRLEPNGNSLI